MTFTPNDHDTPAHIQVTRAHRLPWEEVAADPTSTDGEALYLFMAYTSRLDSLPITEQAARLTWTTRKVFRVRAALKARGYAL